MPPLYKLGFIIHKPREIEIYTKKDAAGSSGLKRAVFRLRYKHFQFRFPNMPNSN